MRRAVLAVLAMPAAAALAIGGVLVASGHTTVPPLVPARSPATTRPAQAASAGPCAGGLPEPFAGVAVNPGIGEHVASFERATGAHVRVVEFYNAFDAPFQKWEAQQALAANALPLIQLNPRHISLALIAAGRYDAHLREYADAVRAYGCRVALSFGHEMNGWWYTWGRPWTTPATFIAAWRHIHDVFAARHVTNVIWSWDPTHQYKQYQHGKVASFASEWFPGNAYVDWIGIDGYLAAGQGFADVFGRQLRDIRRVSSKPVYLAETGVAAGPAEPAQVASLFAAVRRWHLIGLVWFDLDRKQSWSLEGRPAADAAYRMAVAAFPMAGR